MNASSTLSECSPKTDTQLPAPSLSGRSAMLRVSTWPVVVQAPRLQTGIAASRPRHRIAQLLVPGFAYHSAADFPQPSDLLD